MSLEEQATKAARPNWVFLLQWVIISIVLIPSLIFIAVLLSQTDVIPFNTNARVILASIAAGLLIGGLQWIVLRALLPEAGWWVVATVDGFGAGFLMSYFASRVVFAETLARYRGFADDSGRWERIAIFLFIATLALIPSGILQWLVLRKQQFTKAGFWPAVWLLAEIGVIGFFVIPSLTRPSDTVSISTGEFLLMMLGSGLLFAALTGAPFIFLMDRPGKTDEHRPWLPLSRRTAFGWVAGGLVVLIVDSVVLGVLSRPAIRLYEDFDAHNPNWDYAACVGSSIVRGRLRFVIEKSFMGCDVLLPDSYEDFTLVTAVFPVGATHDGSVNISFRHNYWGWYEIQFRPAQKQIHVMKVVSQNGEADHKDITDGWITTPNPHFKTGENELRLVARRNAFTFWFNEVQIAHFEDTEPQVYTSGTIRIGAGAAENGDIIFEYDQIRIWEP